MVNTDDNWDDWAEDFQFSEDLRQLEEAFQESHRDSLTAQMAAADSSMESTLLSDQDLALADVMSVEIARRLERMFRDPKVLAQYLRLEELRKDNVKLSDYIHTLLQEKLDLLEEVETLKARQNQYKPLLGSLYLKLS